MNQGWGWILPGAQAGLMKTKEDIGILLSATFPRSVAPSPLPCTRGRGSRGEGVRVPSETRHFCADHAPSPPTPLPRVQGRGEIEGAMKTG
jgi:hypothetical protein